MKKQIITICKLKCVWIAALYLIPFHIYAQLNISVTNQEPTCYGFTNGRATVNVTGGRTPYYFRFSTGQQGAYNVHEGIGGGNYSVTVTDADNLSAIFNYTMGQPTQHIVTIDPVSGICGGIGDDYIARSRGGIAPYTYVWSNGTNGNIITRPAEGGYYVTATDATGCIGNAFKEVRPRLGITASAVNVVCGGMCDGSVNTTTTGGTPPYRYRWSYGNFSGTVASPLPSGTYTVTVTDANNCTATATASVQEPPILSANFAVSGNICVGNVSATVTGIGGLAPYRYQWSTGATTQTVTGLQQGFYFVTIYDANNCTKDTSVAVSNATLPLATAVTPITCDGQRNGSITLHIPSGLGGYRYRWSNGDTTLVINNLAAGTYTVTLTDTVGCVRNASAEVRNGRTLVAEVRATNISCANVGSATVTNVINGIAPFRYNWSNGGNTQTITNLLAGNYTVTVTDSAGCQAVANTVILNTGGGNITANINTINSLCGNSLGRILITDAAGGIAPYRYRLGTTTNITGIFDSLAVGNYAVKIIDSIGCERILLVEIRSDNTPLNIEPRITNTVCGGNNGQIRLTMLNGTAPFSYTLNGVTNTNGIFTNLTANLYSASVRDSNGCTGSLSNLNVAGSTPSSLSTTLNVVGNVCVGNVTATVEGQNGRAPYTYAWSTGATSQTITGLQQGIYNVTVTDDAGCARDTIVRVSNATLILVTTATDASCSGANNGSLQVTVPSGLSPFTYLWSNGSSTATLSNVTAGQYLVTVTDAAGCVRNASAEVRNQRTLTPIITVVPTPCGSARGEATVTGLNNGTAPFTYLWSNGSTSQTITNLLSGTYIVTVSEVGGCRGIANAVVNNSNANFSVSLNIVNAACNSSNGTVIVSPRTGGTAPFTFTIGSNSNSSGVFNNLAAGNYRITIRDNNGCQTDTIARVGSGSAPLNVDFVVTNTSCGQNNGRIRLNPLSGTSPFRFTLNGATNTTGVFDSLSADIYNVLVVDANGCQGIISNINIMASNNTLAANAAIRFATCSQRNGGLTINATGGRAPYTFRLNDTTTNNTGFFDRLRPGNYIVQVTDADGCSVNTTANAVQSVGDVIGSFSYTSLRCEGNSVRIRFDDRSSLNVLDRTWRFSNGDTADILNPEAVFNGANANVTYIVRSGEGCTDTIRENIVLQTLAFRLPDTISACASVATTINLENLNPTSIPQYTWSPSALVVSGGDTDTPSILVPSVGRRQLIVRVRNALGCEVSDTVVINAIDRRLDTLLVTQNTDCQNGLNVQFNNTNTSAGSYIWHFGDGTTASNSANINHTYLNAGTYTVRLIPNLACLDTITRRVTVTNGALVSLNVNNDTIVCSGNINLNATTNVNNIVWSRNRDFTPPLSTNPNLSVTPTSRREVYYIRATDGRCSQIDSVIIGNGALQVNRNSSIALCSGDNRQITVTSIIPNDNLTFNWTASSGLTIAGATTNTPTISGAVTGNLIGVIQNQFGCQLRDTIPVHLVNLRDSLVVRAQPDTIFKEETTQLSVTNRAGWTYRWTPANTLSNPNISNPIATPTDTTTYLVTVTDPNGCSAQRAIKVTVITPNCSAIYVYLPNVFSPNADGTNDKFYVMSDYVKEATLVIYNRWGEEVYRIENIAMSPENGWDGTHKGKQVCPDVYGWYVTGFCLKGEPFFMKGNVTVMK